MAAASAAPPRRKARRSSSPFPATATRFCMIPPRSSNLAPRCGVGQAPDPAPVDPVLPAPDPAALRGPVAALRDCVARAAAQEDQGAGVRLIGLQALVFDEVSQIFHQHRTLSHRINARLGIARRASANAEISGSETPGNVPLNRTKA